MSETVFDLTAPLPDVMDTEQVAAILNVHPTTVRREVRAGRLKARIIGQRTIRITRRQLDAYLEGEAS